MMTPVCCVHSSLDHRACLCAASLCLALFLSACTNYDSDSDSAEIFREREPVPQKWDTLEKVARWEADAQERADAEEKAPSHQAAPEGAEGSEGEGVPSPSSAESGDKGTKSHRLPLREDELLSWVYQLNNPEIVELTEHALDHNFALAQSWQRLEGMRHLARIDGSGLYPQLSLGLGATRGSNNPLQAPRSNITGSVNLRWEIDYLGSLSNERRAAVMRYQSAWQSHRQRQLTLVSDIASAWYTLEERQRLLTADISSLGNLKENLEILEQGFRAGIVNGLDVLLARNDVAQQEVSVAVRRTDLASQSRSLRILLGQYPDSSLRVTTPESGSEWLQEMEIPPGTPSDLLRRRPDLNAAWHDVLAADLDLAAASKARFPQLTLTGSNSGAGGSPSQLIDTGFGAWSLGVSLVQTLFDGGRKRAIHRRSKTELARIELAWLEKVYQSFREVEILLTQYYSRKRRITQRFISLNSSEEAYELALEQYTNGTANYSTLLQAQRRVIQARTAVISTEAVLRRNRVQIHAALGGPWPSAPDNRDQAAAPASDAGSTP